MDTPFEKAIKQSIHELHTDIQVVQWTPDQLRNFYMNQTMEEMKELGTIHYAHNSIQRTIYLKHLTQQKDINSFLYLELSENRLWVPEGIITAHAFLMVSEDNNLDKPDEELQYVNIASHNTVYWGKGQPPEDAREKVRRFGYLTKLEGIVDPKKKILDNYTHEAHKLPFNSHEERVLEAERLVKEDENPERIKIYHNNIKGKKALDLKKLF